MEEKKTRAPQLMRANVPVGADEIFGYALVTYLEENAADADRVMDALRGVGVRCRENLLSIERLSESSYTDTVLPLLEGCICYIPVLSDALLSEATEGGMQVLKNHMWYQIGYFSSWNTEEILDDKKRSRLFCPVIFPRENAAAGQRLTLAETPMQEAHIDYLVEQDPGNGEITLSQFAKTLAKRCPLLVRDRFYGKDTQLDSEAEKRIGYRRISLCLPIAEEDYKKAYEESHFSEEEFQRVIEKRITCGVRLFRFGKAEDDPADEEIPLLPYLRERDIVEGDYPTRHTRPLSIGEIERLGVLQRRQFVPSGSSDVHGEYHFDLILPVHTLFGVCFKLYLETSTMTAKLLGQLFASALGEKNDPVAEDGERGRLWFSLALAEKATMRLPKDEGYGTRIDVIYPK